ncbi:AT-rich interactive domain-containing 2-like protein [Melia azedarach]|uniref:AT-rich interactive domain-containing 2-like protein n=1 Tax=Melia azedarach TaxID=155640 RepID=A0ACC1XQG7_MELAZ|nr:AT-rich interactive domain-containing 2-like protein [Melia azedarach]
MGFQLTSNLLKSNMVQKRPFDDEEAFEVSSKYPRQMEHGNQLVSSLESGLSEDACLPPHISGGTEIIQSNTGGDQKLASGILAEHQGSAEDVQSNGQGCISMSSWPTSSTSEEDSQPATPVHDPVYSEYLFPEHPTRQLYALLMVYRPQKSVSVGHNHQADIPAWGSQCATETSNHSSKCVVSGSEHIAGIEYEKMFMGTCIIPMPDLESSAYHDVEVGNGRKYCLCEDKGSVRCVRQHIMEEREELGKYLGQERFVQLGFPEMGEVVSDKWSDKEEQLFHKIVYTNPASLGRNFWNVLSSAFPSRTKKDIISYYFNVFMLRKRAVQNRCHEMNVDSDNDEWQGIDDSDDNETAMSDEDEDSVVESPAYPEDFGHNRSKKYDLRIYEGDGTCNSKIKDFVCGTNNTSQANSNNPISQLQLQGEKGDREVQDDSCTTSDTGVASHSQAKADNNEDHIHWPQSSSSSSYNEVKNGYGGVHDFTLEPSGSKVWDSAAGGGSYTSYQNKVDLLPTCSMIKEVFGDGKS